MHHELELTLAVLPIFLNLFCISKTKGVVTRRMVYFQRLKQGMSDGHFSNVCLNTLFFYLEYMFQVMLLIISKSNSIS